MLRKVLLKSEDAFLIFLAISVMAGFVCLADSAWASSTDGLIDIDNRRAWTENVGWLDFGTSEGDVHVSDTALTGYAWGENVGWLSLNCSNTNSCATVDYKITNNSEGTLAGQAYSETVGWVSFNPTGGGVTIDSVGDFHGTAWGENIGWIFFNCAETSSCATVNYKVKTDWRPASTRVVPVTNVGSSGSSGFIQTFNYLLDSVNSIPLNPLNGIIKKAVKIATPSFVSNWLKDKEKLLPALSLQETLSKQAPLALRGIWEIMPAEASSFALAPLPRETRLLASKFPELEKTLTSVGVSRMADVGKLETASLDLPGLSTVLGLAETKRVGDNLLTIGVPIESLSAPTKQKLPSDIVFARAFGGKLDINTNLTFNNLGQAKQQVTTTVGKTLSLVVKPEAPVKSVKGYLALTNQTEKTAVRLPMNSLMASAIFATPKLAYQQQQPITKDTKFILAEFEYEDPDNDGIYTAEVQAPLVAGNYEVITVMDYLNPQLGAKEIRLIAVVDPEGYVFTKSGNLEARVPGATVSLFWFNEETKQFELWPAKPYLQKNPQQTNKGGNYSFLVPEGRYYLAVLTSGYQPYESEQFEVTEGNSVHTNIELIPTGWQWLDWKLILLFLLGGGFLALFYRLYGRRIKIQFSNYK